jgi:hypothetical protein
MTINFDSHGYGFIKIFNEDGRKKFRIARLVAMTFIPNPDNLSTVDHINRIKTDNRVENLRWASHDDQAENRDTAKGERNGVSVLTEEQVLKIKALRKQGLGYRKIARLLDCTNSHVITAINNWKHLD